MIKEEEKMFTCQEKKVGGLFQNQYVQSVWLIVIYKFLWTPNMCASYQKYQVFAKK